MGEDDGKEIVIKSADKMAELAADLARTLKGGEALLLLGDLGAGKTTFVKALAAALGVTATVTSPTFNMVAEYDAAHPVIKKLVHVDLYRLAPEAVAQTGAIREVLESAAEPSRLTVIEWAKKLPEKLKPAGAITLGFEHGSQASERVVRIN